MRKWIDIGTDVATIGIWDPACERHDLASASRKNYQAGLETEAEAGRLFFINTFADGSYPALIFADDVPSVESLSLHDSSNRLFRINCNSGRLIAGGIEDFVNRRKSITTIAGSFSLPPGSYSIQLFVRSEERLTNKLRAELGEEDYCYYVKKAEETPWGCAIAISMVPAAMLLWAGHWEIACSVLILGFVVALFRRRTQKTDLRYQILAERAESLDHECPPFIYLLKSIPESSGLTGGWHDLE